MIYRDFFWNNFFKRKRHHLYFVIVIILFYQNINLRSQFIKFDQINISGSYYRGFLSDKQKRNLLVMNQYINGFSISLSGIPDGSKEWHSQYNFPENGYTLIYLGTGNPKILGHIISASRYIDFHLLHKRMLDIDCRTALGAAFTSKVFKPLENSKNIFFSKHVNFFFELNLSAEYNLLKEHDVFINGGISFMHASNGETKLPNNGISAITCFVGLSKKTKPGFSKKELSKVNNFKKLRISFLPTVGWKENWRYGSEKYLELSFSSGILYALNRKQLIGTGFDIFYDETRMAYSNHNTDPVDTYKESISGGIHLVHQLCLSPFYIVFKTGINIINKDIVNSKSYNIIGIKYNIIPGLYTCMYHKSHGFFYGDNIQWGIGFEL